MTSNFDKALNDSAESLRAVEAADAARKKETLRWNDIARSIAEPYLRDLAPKVMKKNQRIEYST
jgi:hypothetical protein